MKNKKGFTLTELMVVVLIMASLAAIGYPMYTKSVMKARVAEALTLSEIVREARQRNLVVNPGTFFIFNAKHASNGSSPLIKGGGVTVVNHKLKKGKYTVEIYDGPGYEQSRTRGCTMVKYGPDENNPIFTIYSSMRDSTVWCEPGVGVDAKFVCGAIPGNMLGDLNTLQCFEEH